MQTDANLEDAITLAVQSPTDPNYDRVLPLLSGRELFVRLLTPDDGRQTMETVPAGPLQCVRLFTTKTHPLLALPFGGMTWEAALGMIAKLPRITGVIVVNGADDWVAYGKELLLQRLYAGQKAN